MYQLPKPAKKLFAQPVRPWKSGGQGRHCVCACSSENTVNISAYRWFKHQYPGTFVELHVQLENPARWYKEGYVSQIEFFYSTLLRQALAKSADNKAQCVRVRIGPTIRVQSFNGMENGRLLPHSGGNWTIHFCQLAFLFCAWSAKRQISR